MTRRTQLRVLMVLVSLFAMVAIVSLVALRRFRLPPPTGPYPVGTCILEFVDQSRSDDASSSSVSGRHLVVQLWYPAAASRNPLAAYQRWQETTLATSYESLLQTDSRMNAPVAASSEPFPVLVFGHRWAGERTQNTDLAEDLASHGYVVAAVDHPSNSSRVLLKDGRVIKGTEQIEGPEGPAATAAQQIAYWNTQLDVWAADDIFVLNQLARKNSDAGDIFRGRLDTEHVGTFGHSFGGAVSIRLCGLDPRIKAAVNLDGWTFGALKDRTAAEPVMFEYEQAAVDVRRNLQTAPQPGTTENQLDRADNAAVDASLESDGGYRLYVTGTQHLDFTDQPLLPPLRRGSFTGPIAPKRVQQIIRQTVLAFFDQSLRGQASMLLTPTQQEFGDVRVESWQVQTKP